MCPGGELSLGELYDRHDGAAYSLALVIVGEGADAEEVVADAFGQAWRTAGQFDPARGSVAAWLTTITRTRALDLCRARGRRARAVTRASRENTEGFAVPIAAGGDPPDRAVERREARPLVERAPAEPPKPQRPARGPASLEAPTPTENTPQPGAT